MNKIVNIKFVFVLFLAIAVSSFALIQLNNSLAEGAQNLYESVSDFINNKTETKTEVHGNSNENMKPHIVYEIYGVDEFGAKTTIKYGISSRKNYKRKEGNARPNLQLKPISKNPLCEHFRRIEYKVLNENVAGRKAAKILEKKYVSEYFYNFSRTPLLQELPLPEEELFKF